MPKLIAQTGSAAITGEFGCENFGPDVVVQPNFILPVASTLPIPTYASGQIIYIPVSGILAVTSGGVWKTRAANTSVMLNFSATGLAPNDATISGSLWSWIDGTSPYVSVATGSGLSSMTNRAPRNPTPTVQNISIVSGSAANLPSNQGALFFNGSLSSLPRIGYSAGDPASSFNGDDMPMTFITVYNPIDTVGGGTFHALNTTTSNNNWWGLFLVAGNAMRSHKKDNAGTDFNVAGVTGVNLIVPTGQMSILTWVCSGVVLDMYINGSGALSAQSGYNAGTTSYNTSQYGTLRRLVGENSPLYGYQTEALLYSSGLSNTERIKIETYLAQRHGIVIKESL